MMRRRWVLAPIGARSAEHAEVALRPTTPTDDAVLVALLDAAYAGTIDDDPDADHARELAVWRKVDGADDMSSTVAIIGDEIVGTCLIGADLDAPFVYDVAVRPSSQRAGIGAAVLHRSLSALDAAGAPGAWAWITDGNIASERLFTAARFRPSQPMELDDALAWYRSMPDPLD